jgi:putative nucleotidyltransferase with HDIG domain
MKGMHIRFLRSFQSKVMLVLILSLLFVGALNNFLIYRYALSSQFNDLRTQLKVIAQTAALMFDAESVLQVPASRDSITTPEFRTIAEKLRRIKNTNPPIRYIYIMARTDKENMLRFVVDPDLPEKKEEAMGLLCYPGDLYDATAFPEMLKGFIQPSADTKLGKDPWGITLSGYAPIRDKKGRGSAVLGVDITAAEVFLLQKQVHARAAIVLVLGIILALALSLYLSRRITDPIKKLVDGTHHIAEGNLRHHVEVQGSDEMVELSHSFNHMSHSLYKARKKLLSYFYRVVQSLVRVMEAKDHYIRGHSERVGEYAEKIARKMEIPEDKIELLKEIALLHDIGKLGIHESILNKRGKLTDREWEIIKKHPLIGEDILKPILISREMLEIVKSHHERYDGNGYPNRLSGENIGIFAAIVSVADAYDAMTSPRAYRPPLKQEAAVEELKKNRGSQFNARVVDALLEILCEDEASKAS